jgi:zinc protease
VAGVDVVTVPTAIRDVVTLRAAFPGGAVGQPAGRVAVADLTAALLDQGTVARDKFAVAALLEQAGAEIRFDAGTHTVDVAAKCLRDDLPLVLSLLAEQLRTPRFDPAEFAKVQRRLAGQLRRDLEEPGVRASVAFARAAFPPSHPNHRAAPEDYLADLERTTLAEVRAFHAATYGTAGARLVAVGDVDDAALDQALAQGFRDWTGGRAWTSPPPAAAPAAARVERLPLPDKTSVALLIGAPSGLRHRDEDHLAVATGTAVFGSGFFSARLLDIIRNREGLTYGIGAALGGDTHVDGAWTLQGTFGPELLARGQESTVRELRRFLTAGVTEEELANFKVTLTGSFQLGLATTEGLAGALLACLQRGYGPEWIDAYPGRVEALTAAQVNAALRRHLDPDRMITVLAGPLP